jgi:hypothetical protein
MSTIISTVQAAVLDFSLLNAVQLTLGAGLIIALLSLFQPLLRGVARALMLVFKPKLSKEQQLQRRQMRDAMMLTRMLNTTECDPSHAAELRAMAARA